jgi:hypothetical protein
LVGKGGDLFLVGKGGDLFLVGKGGDLFLVGSVKKSPLKPNPGLNGAPAARLLGTCNQHEGLPFFAFHLSSAKLTTGR